MKSIAVDVADLQTIGVAVLDPQGVLIEANAGFGRLLPAGACKPGLRAGRFFIQPTFAGLTAAAAAGAAGYCGLMTIGDIEGKTRTLRGRAWRTAVDFRVMAEYDIDSLEKLADTMLALNHDSLRDQHDLTRANVTLRENETRIVEQSLTDPLTGLGNRRRLEQAMAAEIARARRNGEPLSLIMADIDHFKRVNDSHGHDAGDKVLARFAQLLATNSRPSDIVARFGGEEFILLLPNAKLVSAVARAEAIRQKLATEIIAPLEHPVTSSFGAAELAGDESGDEFLKRVDAALYEAKASGRDRVVASTLAAACQPDRSHP